MSKPVAYQYQMRNSSVWHTCPNLEVAEHMLDYTDIKMRPLFAEEITTKPWVSLSEEDVLKASELVNWDSHSLIEYEQNLEDIMKRKNGVSIN